MIPLFVPGSDVDEISDWLEAMDQGFYVNSFAANGIDGRALINVRIKGEDQGKLLEGIRQSRAAAEQEAEQQQNGPLVLTPHMTRALQRNIIMPHRRGAPLNQEVRNDATPPLWLRLLLFPCGYREQQQLWIHDVDLAGGVVVIVNHSSWSVDIGRFQLCNEEGRQKFDFPSQGFIVPAHGRVQVHCGAIAPSPTHELLLYWQPEHDEPVLAREGDAVYLWDAGGRIVSALAKSGDGSSKRYAPSTAERLHNSFHNLSQFLGCLRLCLLAAAMHFSLWPLLGSAPLGSKDNFQLPIPNGSSLDLECFIYCLLADCAFDLAQRAAAERSGTNKQSLSHAVALLGDRAHSLVIYALLVASQEGSYAALFLFLGTLEFVNCFLRMRRSWPHPKYLVAMALRAPALLPIVALLSESFLVCLSVGHPYLWATLSQHPTPPLLWSPRIATRVLSFALAMSLQYLLARGGTCGDDDAAVAAQEERTVSGRFDEQEEDEGCSWTKNNCKDPALGKLSDLVRRSYGSVEDFERRHQVTTATTTTATRTMTTAAVAAADASSKEALSQRFSRQRSGGVGRIREEQEDLDDGDEYDRDRDHFQDENGNKNSSGNKASHRRGDGGGGGVGGGGGGGGGIVRRSNRRQQQQQQRGGGGGGGGKRISSALSTMSSVDGDEDDVSMDGRGAGGRDVSPLRPNLFSMRATRLTSLSGKP